MIVDASADHSGSDSEGDRLLARSHDAAPPVSSAGHRHRKVATPAWAWPLLALATLAISSAGTVFSTLAAVPPLTRASWRLQLTAILLVPPSCYQLAALLRDPVARPRLLRASPLILARSALPRRSDLVDPASRRRSIRPDRIRSAPGDARCPVSHGL